jgi:hypothetical protein
MKRSAYKQALLLLLPFLLIGNITAQEVHKEFHQEYNAGANTTLEINNKYGDVVIDSWDQDKVVIDVKVTVEMPNQEKAQKLLDMINVEFSGTDSQITAKTVMDKSFNFSGWGNNKRFSIDYSVKMPVETALTLVNRYGDSEIDELHGLTNVDVKYGDINIGKLTRGNEKPLNRISIAYGKGTIEEAGWLDLYLRYAGSSEIAKAQALLLDSRYSHLSLGEVSSVVGDNKYDKLNIDKINNLVLQSGYTETRVGTLSKKLEYDGSYGSFSVDDIPANFESVDVNTRYMGVKLGIEDGANYYLQGKVSYGGLDYNEDNFTNKKRIIENNSQEIEGFVGKNESPSSRVNVTASYGSVRLQ